MPPKISIVIPYYQRKPGILRRALASIVAQNREEAYQSDVIVVDDSSPVPATGEVPNPTEAREHNIRIVRQKNGGPAAARNTALNELDPATTFVAFLDSDDEWTPDHLDNAIRALGKDNDFYFADFYHLNQSVSAFRRARRIDPAEHGALPGHPHLHRYQGDMVNQVISGNVIGTSTVVYRYPQAPALRFREAFVNAGEDYLFWLDFTSKNRSIVFSSLCECRYGEGVNIFSGAGWGTEESLKRIRYEIQYRKTVLGEFPVTTQQRQLLAERNMQSRLELARDILHRVRHRKALPLGQLWSLGRLDPLSIVGFPYFLVKILAQRDTGASRPDTST